MKLHEVLTNYRKAKKITFDELAARTGISKSTLQKVFTGVTENPAFELVRTIAAAMDVSVNDIAAATKDSRADIAPSRAAMDVARRYDSLPEYARKLITMITLFESSDVEIKNRIIELLVDHHNELNQRASAFNRASAELYEALAVLNGEE